MANTLVIPEPQGEKSKIYIPERYRKPTDRDKLLLILISVLTEILVLFLFSHCNFWYSPFMFFITLLYLSLIIAVALSLASSRIRKMKNLMVSFFFMFFIPVQGYLTSYHTFSGFISLVCVAMPMLTLLTLFWYVRDKFPFHTDKFFVFFFLYLVSILVIFQGVIGIIHYRFELSSSYFRRLYLEMVFFGILPYTLVFHRMGAKKGFFFTLVAGYVYLWAIESAVSYASYFIDVDNCFGPVDNPLVLLAILSLLGALLGHNKNGKLR